MIEWKKTDVHASHALPRVWFNNMLELCVWPINRTLCLARQQHSTAQQLWLALFNFSYISFWPSLIYSFRLYTWREGTWKGRKNKDYNRHIVRHYHCRLSPYIHYISFQVDEQCAQQLGPDVGLSFSSILFSLSLSYIFMCVRVCAVCIDRVPYTSSSSHSSSFFLYISFVICAAPRELFKRYDAIL